MSITEALYKSIRGNQDLLPNNYTSNFLFRGILYHYHGETEPHNHYGETDEEKWTVVFKYFHPGYRFIGYHLGEYFCIIPEINKPYSFDCLEGHGIIRKSRVGKFRDVDFWRAWRKKPLKTKSTLACIFKFVESAVE